MSSQITTAFVQQYRDAVQHLAQQKGSRLKMAVRNETQVGKTAYYDQLGAATAQLKTARHADTPQLDTPHSRRSVSLLDYEYADLIDQQDKIRLLMDPTSDYAMAAANSLGRAMDDVIISAISGTALTGEAGGTSTVLPTTQKVASVASAAGANLNIQALRQAKRIMDASDVDPSIPRYIAVNASALYSLLGQTEVTSADFNTVRALVNGEIDTFLGFKFIMSNRLVTQSSQILFNSSTGIVAGGGTVDSTGYYKILCWAQDGVLLSLGKDIKVEIGPRADKSYATQVYACMSIGATRMEEVKVVEIHCNQS